MFWVKVVGLVGGRETEHITHERGKKEKKNYLLFQRDQIRQNCCTVREERSTSSAKPSSKLVITIKRGVRVLRASLLCNSQIWTHSRYYKVI